MKRFYPIGVPGQPWTDADVAAWFAEQSVQRSYRDEVLLRLDTLDDAFEHRQYGALPIDPARYPLFSLHLPAHRADAPSVLITGGVHGYETSGVQGALAFAQNEAEAYRDRVNLVIAPCVSPWGYEVIHRWNPNAIDPNRVFIRDSPSVEAAALMQLIADLDTEFLVHMDLHETTDSDESEFRPALAARNGEALEPGLIPDGFYTVGDTENPQSEFQAAIIASVEEVTHVAPADDKGQIIGSDVTQHGVINYPLAELGLCAGMTGATFTTTTEVYPDSPSTTPQTCIEAQVAAVCGGLDFALDSV